MPEENYSSLLACNPKGYSPDGRSINGSCFQPLIRLVRIPPPEVKGRLGDAQVPECLFSHQTTYSSEVSGFHTHRSMCRRTTDKRPDSIIIIYSSRNRLPAKPTNIRAESEARMPRINQKVTNQGGY